MRLLEFESKRIFEAEGIPVPRGEVVSSSKEAKQAADSIGLPVMLKAQALVGRRAKTGAVLVAEDLEQVVKTANDIIGMRMNGYVVNRLLVEEYLPAVKELYFSVTIDDSKGKPIVLASSEGGTEIEEIAANSPEKIISQEIDPLSELKQDQARRIASQIGLSGHSIPKASDVLWRLYHVFAKYDATIAEINPLVITKTNTPCAAGAVLTIDDDALYRHDEISAGIHERTQDEIEKEAAKLGIAYVRLEGNIGVIGSGAGLAMTTMDLIRHYGGTPANFLDTGGRITREHIQNCLNIVMNDPKVTAVLANLYGGINPMIEAAQGIAEFVSQKRPRVPVVVKIRGNFEEQAWDILERAGVVVVKATQTEDAAKLVVELSTKGP